jgi:hypothetical protein
MKLAMQKPGQAPVELVDGPTYEVERDDGMLKKLTAGHLRTRLDRFRDPSHDLVGYIALEQPALDQRVISYGPVSTAVFDGEYFLLQIDQFATKVPPTDEEMASYVVSARMDLAFERLRSAFPDVLFDGSRVQTADRLALREQAAALGLTVPTLAEAQAILSAPVPRISGEQWHTLVKGLPSGQRSALRTAVQNGLAVSLSDADTDTAYIAAARQRKAALYLSNFETDKVYPLVGAALSALGVTLTGPQAMALRDRWNAAAAL